MNMYKFILFSCFLILGKSVVISQKLVSLPEPLSAEESEELIINMGIQNLPDLFYNHYYKYPESINELYTFIENHYDYNESKEIWEPTISYLKKQENNIRVLSQRGLFIISECNHLSYNNSDICVLLALHDPESDYFLYRAHVNLYNPEGRNIKEIIGIDKADSIAAIFRKLEHDIYLADTAKYYMEENNAVKYDKYRRVLLEYNLNEGLKTYCPEEPLVLSSYSFFEKLDSICCFFCRNQNISKMIFSSPVFMTNN